MIQRQAELLRIRIHLTRVFTPESPITQKDSFQGRSGGDDQGVGSCFEAGCACGHLR